MYSLAYHPPESDVKTVKCNNCGADVVINANYPIDAVDSCKHCPIKNDKNLCSLLIAPGMAATPLATPRNFRIRSTI